jgi:hypothetical protein
MKIIAKIKIHNVKILRIGVSPRSSTTDWLVQEISKLQRSRILLYKYVLVLNVLISQVGAATC